MTEEDANARPVISTDFGIWGDLLDLSECTRQIGLAPTTEETKGQARPNGRPPARETYWGIATQKRRLLSIDDSLVELIEILWPHRFEIVEFLSSKPHSASFETKVTIYAERPEYCLSAQTLQRLSFFGIEYCLDIFDCSE